MLEILGVLALGLWTWAAILVVSVLVIIGLEIESGPTTLVFLLVGVALVWFAGGHSVPTVSGTIHWFDQNWIGILIFIGCYVLIGTGWGLAKWLFYLHNVADTLEEGKKKWGWSDASLKEKWQKQTDPFNNKGTITMWMVYWPWSALWTLLNDPIKRLYRAIYQALTTTYQRMANWVYDSRFPDPVKAPVSSDPPSVRST